MPCRDPSSSAALMTLTSNYELHSVRSNKSGLRIGEFARACPIKMGLKDADILCDLLQRPRRPEPLSSRSRSRCPVCSAQQSPWESSTMNATYGLAGGFFSRIVTLSCCIPTSNLLTINPRTAITRRLSPPITTIHCSAVRTRREPASCQQACPHLDSRPQPCTSESRRDRATPTPSAYQEIGMSPISSTRLTIGIAMSPKASIKFDALYQVYTVYCVTPPKGGSADHTKDDPLPLLPETNTSMFTKVTMYHTLLSDQALGWKDGSYGTYAACFLR
ncbi:hypothetical protein KCU83_g559, partial [Aureobasidium melanogenum]